MKRQQLRFGKRFRVALSNARAQVAMMTIAPGDAEGGPTNRHRAADQWLYVLSGTGRALLRTLSFYVPPGYSKRGEELPAAKA
jgi:mannose-6-phosphate isomerase-like protein (cupin superfamily)